MFRRQLFDSLAWEVYLEILHRLIHLRNGRKLGLVIADYVFEIVLLFSVQDVQKLPAKCDTISLLSDIINVWEPSNMELSKSQVFVEKDEHVTFAVLKCRGRNMHDANGRSHSND
jgi:hypothetical protein